MANSKPNLVWQTKIANANKYYKQWEDRFKVSKLEDYWESYQWANIIDIPYYRPYVVNLVYAEIKKKLANILYHNLEYHCSPRPGNFDVDPNFAMIIAHNKEDVLNTLISKANIDNDFNETLKLCAQDSFFRFMVMEVGYAADWRNPAKKPLILSNQEKDDIPDQNARVVEDEELPENERIFYKRIKPSRFRVSTSDDSKLSHCSWAGYYSFIYKRVLEKTKGLNLPPRFNDSDYGYNSEYIGASGFIGSRLSATGNTASADAKDMLEALRTGKVCKVWNIWDNETNVRKLILEPGFEVIWEGDFYHLPFVTHRHDFRFDGWYPIPPVYNWIAPQDEVNQAREQMRNYRRRFTRKFRYWGVENDEIEKFKSETDGEVIKMKTPNAILEPIPNPEIGISIVESMTAGRDDFNLVSGSSSDLSSIQKDRTTATQSKITAMKAQVIESIEQIEFTKVYEKIARLTLLEARYNFTEGMWVKNTMDPSEAFLGQINPERLLPFRYISTQDLGHDGFDVDIRVNCINATPLKMQEEYEKFIKFMTTVRTFPEIALSPLLIRETAFRSEYHNERVIAEMQKMATLTMVGMIAGQGQMGAQGSGDNGAAQNMQRNAAPSSQDAIDQQLISR